MDYRKIIIPFLSKAEIKSKADLFRKRFWNKSVPVDIENIIEISLKISLVPVPGFQDLCDADALIASNWRYIYVDNDRYLDERYRNRLKFSLAHEMGHFILHKEVYKNFNIKGWNDYYKLLKEFPQEQYGYLEFQANNFANYLLVPRDVLAFEKGKALEKFKRNVNFAQLEKVDTDTLNSYLAIPISKVFEVSDSVIYYALNKLEELEK